MNNKVDLAQRIDNLATMGTASFYNNLIWSTNSDSGGALVTALPTHQSYNPLYFGLLYQVEDRHFWFRARNRLIATVVKCLTADLPRGYRVLEIGCGTGNVLRVLEQECTGGSVVGIDLFLEGLRYARHRTGALLVQGDMRASPFGVPFDLICLFDVLEHLPNDHQILCDLQDMLTENGRLLITVPAHPCLWSYFDEASGHCRRYKPVALKSKLIATGYQVEYLTQYMTLTFPWVWLRRRVAKMIAHCSKVNSMRSHELALRELRITPVLNDLLAFLLSLETHVLARRYSLPIGTSLLAVARKRPA